MRDPVSDDVKIADLPTVDQTFDAEEAATMGWGEDKPDGGIVCVKHVSWAKFM